MAITDEEEKALSGAFQGQLRTCSEEPWTRGLPAQFMRINIIGSAAQIAVTAQITAQGVVLGQVQLVSPSRAKFNELATQWRRDTRFTSSLAKIVMDSSYQTIIGMGMETVPWILSELQERGGHWLWALRHITQEDPAKEGDDFAAAKSAWLAWGRVRGYI